MVPMKGLFSLFMSLAVGYALCVVAKKQAGVLKSLGYALGVSIIVLSLACGLLVTSFHAKPMFKCMKMHKMSKMASCESMPCPTK